MQQKHFSGNIIVVQLKDFNYNVIEPNLARIQKRKKNFYSQVINVYLSFAVILYTRLTVI